MSMNTEKKINIKKYILVLTFVSIAVALICLCAGRYRFALKDVIFVFAGDHASSTGYNVMKHIRIPRVLLSYLIGIALAVSGAAYQSLFHNRLISPGVLGVNSGACVGAGICILMGCGTVARVFFAFVFGIAAALLALGIQKISKNKSALVLVLAGIVVSALMNALIGIIKYMADGENKLASITFWMLGSIADAEISHVYFLLPFVIVCTGIILAMGWRLNAMSLGEREAMSVGINYKRERLIVICCSTLLTSVSISISGSIDWVGLIIPNIVRSLVGGDNRKILPLTILLGGIFMMIVDTLARSISPNEIPLGIITGLFGAIAYFFILISKKGID